MEKYNTQKSIKNTQFPSSQHSYRVSQSEVYVEPGSFLPWFILLNSAVQIYVDSGLLTQFSARDILLHWKRNLNISKTKLIQATSRIPDFFTAAKNHLPSYQGLCSGKLTLSLPSLSPLNHLNPIPFSLIGLVQSKPYFYAGTKFQKNKTKQKPTFQISRNSAPKYHINHLSYHLFPIAARLSHFWAPFPNKSGPISNYHRSSIS